MPIQLKNRNKHLWLCVVCRFGLPSNSFICLVSCLIGICFIFTLAPREVSATSLFSYEAVCGCCGGKSPQRDLNSFSVPFTPEMDFQPIHGIRTNLLIMECPHCGYMACQYFSKKPQAGVCGVMKGQSFMALKDSHFTEYEKIPLRFKRLALLDEAREDFLGAGLSYTCAAWATDPGYEHYEKEFRGFDDAKRALQQQFNTREQALRYEQGQRNDDAVENEIAMLWEVEYRAELVKARYALMQEVSTAQQEEASLLRKQAIVNLEKILMKPQPLEMNEYLTGLFVLMEMYRRTECFLKATKLLEHLEQSIAVVEPMDQKEFFAGYLKRQREFIYQQDSRRRLYIDEKFGR